MRELVFSVGITFLTGTLLFVYFRNKMNIIDNKVSMVFQTIQEHNLRMQNEAQEELRRFQLYHQQKMQMEEENNSDELTQENVENLSTSPNNLIDVSDQESVFSDNSSNEDSDDESDAESDVDSENENENQNQNHLESNDVNKNLSDNKEVSELLNDVVEEIHINQQEKSDGLQIMEDKLNIKSLDSLVNYNKYTKAELRNICEEKGLTGWKSLNKGKLVEFLENN